MPIPIKVSLVSSGEIHVIYDDGMEGNISIKNTIEQIDDVTLSIGEYPNVVIDDVSNDILVEDEVYLCKDAIYRQLELKALMKRLKLELPE